MTIFTVAQRYVGMGIDTINDVMWTKAYPTLAKAKYAIEEDAWDRYCETWDCEVDCGYELPECEGFVDWQQKDYADCSCYAGFSDHDDCEYSIQETELV